MTAGSSLRNTTEPTDTEIEDIFVGLDTQFNEVMINALTHGERIQTRMVAQGTLGNFRQLTFFEGIYTGVVAVTLRTIGLSSSLLLMFLFLTGKSSFKR